MLHKDASERQRQGDPWACWILVLGRYNRQAPMRDRLSEKLSQRKKEKKSKVEIDRARHLTLNSNLNMLL